MRTYDFDPGDAHRYLALFAAEGLPLITRHLSLLGYWAVEVGVLNRLEHAWVYADLDDRAARRARLLSDPDWTEGFLPRGLSTIRRQASRLLAPEHLSDAAERAVASADRRHDPVTEPVLPGGTLTSLRHAADAAARDGDVLRARIVSGPDAGGRLAFGTADDAGAAAGATSLLRAASFSPLRAEPAP